MDLYKIRAWKIAIMLEKMTGIWPYQGRVKNGFICTSLFTIYVSCAVPLAVMFHGEWGINVNIVVENLVCIMLLFGTSVKLLTGYFFQRRRSKIYSEMTEQLKKLQEHEFQIMTYYLEYGLKFTFVYLVLGVTAIIAFNAPSLFKMISSFFTANITTDKPLPYHVDYGIDHNKYYTYIVLHIFVCEICNALPISAHDMSFVLSVQHSCALLSIVKHRLAKALNIAARYRSNQNAYEQDEDAAHHLLIMVINVHNEALQLIGYIDDAYNLSWFFKLIETVIGSGGLFSVVIASSTNLFDCIRYLIYLIFTLVQFNVAFNRGQKIIDHSSEVFHACYDCEWEGMSRDSVSLLRMIMTRSLKPSNLSGGKIFALSNEIYGNMLKTAFSYGAMFNSFVEQDGI